MKALFFVTKPLELMGAIEAIHQLDITEKVLVYTSEKGRDRDTFNYLLEEYNGWDEIHYIDRKCYYGLKWVKLLYKLKKEKYDYAFLRAFPISSYFIHNLNFKKFFLLDDGTATLAIEKEYSDIELLEKRFSLFKGMNKVSFKYKIIEGIYSLLNISVNGSLSEKKIYFFSFFDIENKSLLIKNKLNWLKNKMNLDEKIHRDILVLGTNVCKAKIIDEECYFASLIKLKLKFADKNLYYAPHPRESFSFIEKLEKEGFSICKDKLNLEFELLNSKYKYDRVIGTISTSLVTLKLMFKENLNVSFFKFNEEDITQSKRKSINRLYNYQNKILDNFNQV